MTNTRPLMPKATAVWLVDNTALTFEQIADFCGLHPLEVKGIADGDVAAGIKGMDPVSVGQLTREELKLGEQKATHKLKLAAPKVEIPKSTTRKRGPRYTPVSRRQDRPNAILWLVRNHPELKDAQIGRLAGTTKHTITQVRDRSHWNAPNLVPQDPVTLGLCTQIDLDNEVLKAAPRVPKSEKPAGEDAPAAQTLLPADQTTAPQQPAEKPKSEEDVFGSKDELKTERAERDQTEAEEAAQMLKQLERLSTEKKVEDKPSTETPAADEMVPEKAPDQASDQDPPSEG